MGPKAVTILDTTLRDGEQAEGISYTVQDKLDITGFLDELGVQFIEGGWPGANPKAMAYFRAVRRLNLRSSKVAAFGSTCRAKYSPETDPNIQALIKAETPAIVIFGKTWDFHVKEALKIDLERNLELIEDSVRYLKAYCDTLIFDAEHFLDGYKANPDYAIKTIQAAESGGADLVCLCDTNGGSLPSEVSRIVKAVRKVGAVPIGIHSHNDAGLGVANAIAAVEAGAVHVQGTFNGYGERCGNADLSTIIPNLVFKMGRHCLSKEACARLRQVSLSIDEISNYMPNPYRPYVGASAFAHKGGVHVSAILKHSETYEHIRPEWVGNQQRIVVSEQSGASNIKVRVEELGLSLDSSQLKDVLAVIKEKETLGYQFEAAEASADLLISTFFGGYAPKIKLQKFTIQNDIKKSGSLAVNASINVKVEGQKYDVSAKGVGPVDALDKALRKCIEPVFPVLKNVKLIDYKVRVLNPKECAEAKVRVLVSSSNGRRSWQTVGVSENIIDASWQALVESMEYALMEYEKE